MVDRDIINVADTIYTKRINHYPVENQAAKIFAKWLEKHPNYSPDDVDIRIVTYEQEEDYHGNPGGIDQYFNIYKRRKETNEEHEARVKREENACFEKFSSNIYKHVSDLISDLSIYPYETSMEIIDKRKEIVSSIMDVVHKCLATKP